MIQPEFEKKRFQVFNEPKQHLQTQLYRRVYTIFFFCFTHRSAVFFFINVFGCLLFSRGKDFSSILLRIILRKAIDNDHDNDYKLTSLVIRTWNVLMCCKQIRKIYTKYIRNEFMCAMMHADQFNYLWSDNWNRFDVLYLELFWMQNSA